MSGYTQTLLLDCNRLSSEEYNASKLSDTDNSLYTNKVANGIHLNIGDTVTINSAYISERGAGASVIEFKGKELGKETQLTYTNVSNTSFVGFGEKYKTYVLPFPDGYGIQEYSNITENIPIQDNKVSIAIQFYKNTNGEMNITLPRRFGSISPGGVTYTNASDYWTKPDHQDTGLNTFSQDASHIYAPDWNPTASGNSLMYVTSASETIHPPTFDGTTGLPASTINGSAILRKIKQDNSRYTIFVKDKIVWAPEFLPGDDVNTSAVLQSEYLESRVFNEDSGGASVETSFRDPALKDYIPFMKKIDLEVGVGYDTPSNIAATLTDKLIETEDNQPLRWNHRGVSGGTDVYANKINSTLYQEFPACNPISFETAAYLAFRSGKNHRPSGTESLDVKAFNYLNNYAYVGFKRPELVMAGRKLNKNNGFHITEDITFVSGSNTVIKTSLEWTDENLENLRDFFEVQGKFYRELISGNRESNSNYTASFLEEQAGLNASGEQNPISASLNASFEDVARFLHINPYSASTLTDHLVLNGLATSYEQQLNVDLAKSSLGNDMGEMPDNKYTYNGSIVSQTFSTSDHTKYDKYPYDLSSLPIYIYYNASSAHLGPNDSDGNGDHNLVYGFARKYQQGVLGPAGDFIAFTTERIGGIHYNIFQDGIRIQNKNPDVPDAGAVAGWPFISGTQIKGSAYYDGGARRIGYDYHFNAYGNAAILLNTGYTKAMYYGHQQKVAFDIARGCYLGADNPLLNFDTVQNRFEFKNLHTAEKIGNYFNSGDPSADSNEIAPPPATGADEDCYKINKVDQYNTWSPSMMPFPDINVTKKGNVSHSLPEPNPNMERDVIMDSECGITITDMGVTEDLWDESIWGILGFSYRQFYPNASIVGNINTRMNNVIINVSGATTNALVTSVHVPEYNVNPFGTTVYTTQQALATDYAETANWMLTEKPADFKDVNTIVIAAESTAISATSLPRKQLRGYFLLSSNIMTDANYYRESNPMGVMAVVDKYNAEGDFINYSGGGTVFTVTKPTTLTEVRTAILDPDGSPAQVDQYSGVIYRIDKKINTDLRFAETILQEENQKK